MLIRGPFWAIFHFHLDFRESNTPSCTIRSAACPGHVIDLGQSHSFGFTIPLKHQRDEWSLGLPSVFVWEFGAALLVQDVVHRPSSAREQ